jgi:hypothetical protein
MSRRHNRIGTVRIGRVRLMAQELPKSIVVIHGVGDQKEDETARELARALGGVFNPDLKWAPPT